MDFFSLKHQRTEQVAGRAVITALALFFLLSAALHALPSRDEWIRYLEAYGLSGYQQAEETSAPPASNSDLEEFYDHPITDSTTASSVVAHETEAVKEVFEHRFTARVLRIQKLLEIPIGQIHIEQLPLSWIRLQIPPPCECTARYPRAMRSVLRNTDRMVYPKA